MRKGERNGIGTFYSRTVGRGIRWFWYWPFRWGLVGAQVTALILFSAWSASSQTHTFAALDTINPFTYTGTFTNTQMNEYITSLLNGVSPTAEYNYIQGANFSTDAFASGAATPVGATVHNINGVASYVTSACNSLGRSVCNTVAGYFSARSLANGAGMWAINPTVQDMAGQTGHSMAMLEGDTNIFGSPAYARGEVIFVGGTGTMPTDGIGLEFVTFGSPMKWNRGIQIGRGVATTGMLFEGANSTANTVSNNACFKGYDAGNVGRTACMNADANGNFIFTPTSGGGYSMQASGGGIGYPNSVGGTNTLQATAGTFPSTTTVLPTVGGTLPGRTASIDPGSQSASIGSTLAYSVTQGGQYAVTIYGVISQAATTSSTLPTACVQWTDADSNGAVQQIFNVTASGLTNTSNTTATFESGTITINPKVSTTVNYAFGAACPGGSAYASVGGTPMLYIPHVRVIEL